MFHNALKSVQEADKKYPNRHNEVHKECCKNCPSKDGQTDPEVEWEIANVPKEQLVYHAFPCAWRASKLCKGICDNYGIDEEFIKKIKGR